MSSFSDKLKDPRWQKKRLEIMQRDNFTCQDCESAEKTLHVHHKTYQFGKEPWDYPDENFITLCWECHESEEYAKNDFNAIVANLLLDGYSYQQLSHFLGQLEFPMVMFTKDERIRFASFSASNQTILDTANHMIESSDTDLLGF